MVRAEKRDALLDFLRKQEIGAAIYYSRPFHQMSCFKPLVKKTEKFPRSEKAGKTALALPIFPELKAEEIGIVSDAIHEFFGVNA